jgi:hypothetical protein
MIVCGALNPGHPEEYYQHHVRAAGPIVSILAGIPVFFLLAGWQSRKAKGKAGAIALWMVWAVLDTAILLGLEGPGAIGPILPFWLASHATKFASAWAGAR